MLFPYWSQTISWNKTPVEGSSWSWWNKAKTRHLQNHTWIKTKDKSKDLLPPLFWEGRPLPQKQLQKLFIPLVSRVKILKSSITKCPNFREFLNQKRQPCSWSFSKITYPAVSNSPSLTCSIFLHGVQPLWLQQLITLRLVRRFIWWSSPAGY